MRETILDLSKKDIPKQFVFVETIVRIILQFIYDLFYNLSKTEQARMLPYFVSQLFEALSTFLFLKH